jgi:hypothetical protein
MMALLQFFAGVAELAFRPLTLFTVGGVFQACAKFVLSGFKRLTSLPVPVLRGCAAPWDDDDARDLNLNLGMDRR